MLHGRDRPKYGVPLDSSWPPGSQNMDAILDFRPWPPWEAPTGSWRTWARTTPGIDFWAKLLKQKLLDMFRWVVFYFFRTARTIWVRSRHQRLPGVGREQGRHQGLIFEQSCWNKSCLGCLGGLISTFSGQPGPSGWGPDTKDCQE